MDPKGSGHSGEGEAVVVSAAECPGRSGLHNVCWTWLSGRGSGVSRAGLPHPQCRELKHEGEVRKERRERLGTS